MLETLLFLINLLAVQLFNLFLMNNNRVILVADIKVEKGEFDILVLSLKEAHSTILLIYTLLCNPPFNHVHTRSWTAHLGHMLRTCNHVHLKYPPSTKSIPFLNAILTIWKHNVRHQIQRYGFRIIPARKHIRMGCHQENRQVIRIWPARFRRARIKKCQRRKNPKTIIRIWAWNVRKTKRTRSSGRGQEEEPNLQKRTRARMFVADCCHKKSVICTWDTFLLLVVSRPIVSCCRVRFDRWASVISC